MVLDVFDSNARQQCMYMYSFSDEMNTRLIKHLLMCSILSSTRVRVAGLVPRAATRLHGSSPLLLLLHRRLAHLCQRDVRLHAMQRPDVTAAS